jgi:DNA-binding transcriptional LysR family regulator
VDRADLGGETFIDFHPSWAIRRMNDEALAARGVHRLVRCTVNDVHTLLDLVDRGLGVALVPRHVAAKPQAARLVAVPLVPDGGADWVVSVVTNAGERPDSPAPHLVELLDEAPVPAA